MTERKLRKGSMKGRNVERKEWRKAEEVLCSKLHECSIRDLHTPLNTPTLLQERVTTFATGEHLNPTTGEAGDPLRDSDMTLQKSTTTLVKESA